MSFLIRRALGQRIASAQSTKIAFTTRSCLATVHQRFNSTSPVVTPSPVVSSLDDLKDAPGLVLDEGLGDKVDWSRSFHGLSAEPFAKEVADILLAPLVPEDVEIKPGNTSIP